jgi:hypothetical protein
LSQRAVRFIERHGEADDRAGRLSMEGVGTRGGCSSELL